MATTCLQCNKKIGLFKKPIEGLYCSYDCRNEARAQQERLRFEASERVRVENERLAREAAERAHSEVVRRVRSENSAACPKCGEAWNVSPGGGSLGQDRGACRRCGFVSDFMTIDACPHCRCQSLIVQASGTGRCPRCKTRVEGARNIA